MPFVVDGRSIPLAVALTAANLHDSRVLVGLIDAVVPIPRLRGWPGRPRTRPQKLDADKGYDLPAVPEDIKKSYILPRIARRYIEPSERLGRSR